MTETMSQGLVLMVLGMGTVFCFLALSIIALNVMSRFLIDAPVATVPADTSSAAQSDINLQDPELLSAITAAVHTFRAKRDKNSQNTK